MTAAALNDFMLAPFGIIADVKMLNFFRDLGFIGVAVLGSLVIFSVLIRNFWCRFLCPYGALMGLVSALSPVRVRRDAQACIDCGKCNKACLLQIQSLECTSCMECVAVCPAENALQLALSRRGSAPAAGTPGTRWRGRTVQPRTVVAVLALLFFGLIGAAYATGHWQTDIPRDVYMQLIPHADDYGHQESLN